MTAKEQLLQELNFTPDPLIVETLNFLKSLKAKERSNFSTGASLLAHLKTIGTWQGNDLDECWQDIADSRLPVEFSDRANPFD
jgi:hypothetical protein